MKLTIDTTGKRFTVTKRPEPKVDQNGKPRLEKGTDLPLWSTQVVVVDAEGGDIITITTVGHKIPDLEPEDPVTVEGLVAIPWQSTGRNGIAYRAESINLIDEDER